ncbi:ribonuclease J [Faecalibaculum rodentium]|uniref:ribonuclease J n=1 Tax=Faecalibaculum rodentium TaxID=1702221 RepID=UPI00273006BB|nr:ribonuclease J [Faecalibaculum rodentium]
MPNKNNTAKSVKKDATVKIMALGGLDEDGKNMLVVEAGEDIYIIEAGLKFPDASQSLGIEYIIQDFSWFQDKKDRVKAIFITHGHDDVMGALPHLLRQVRADIYTAPLAAREISRMLKKEKISGVKIHKINRHDSKRISGRKISFFPVTQSYPGAYGLAISTSQGYVVYSGEFVENFDDLDDHFRGNITICSKLGQEGVLVLMQESKGAERSGNTSPRHRILPILEDTFTQYPDRHIFISVYTQSVYQIQEVMAACREANRPLVLYDKELRRLVDGLEEIGIDIPRHLIIPVDRTRDHDNTVILISGQGTPLFKQLSNIANNEVDDVQFSQDDVIVIASPVVPGVETVYKSMENDIYKRGGILKVIDHKKVLSMHASKEDLKMMIFMCRPKYYLPVKGEYRMLCANAMIAEEMGIDPDHIRILDNGQMAVFEDGELVSCKMEAELHDTMIDGKENWDIAGVVLKDREILSTDGVMVLPIGLDAKTKKIVNGPDIQTRGFIYLRDSEYITAECTKIMEDIIRENVEQKKYENLETRSQIRDKVSKYLFKTTGKRPMVLPVILEIGQRQ